MPIYLDHAAATPVLPRVLERYVEVLASAFANGSATGHAHGLAARELVERARLRVAELVGGEPAGVIFTSGTTEANHLALRGLAPRGRVVTTAVEHASVDAATDGARVPCGADGVVSADDVGRAVTAETELVAVIHGNNEMGAVNDVCAIAAAAANVFVHVDAAQSARYLPLDMAAWGIDTLALSAHKMGGVKGVAALVCSLAAREQMQPPMRGGGQEGGLRPGTLNVPAIDAFGLACAIARDERERAFALADAKRRRLAARLGASLPTVRFMGPVDAPLPHIVSLRVPGIAATLLQDEVRPDVSIATGSACATTKVQPSHVMLALGLSPDEALEVVRLSVAPEMPDADVDAAADCVVAAVKRLGR